MRNCHVKRIIESVCIFDFAELPGSYSLTLEICRRSFARVNFPTKRIGKRYIYTYTSTCILEVQEEVYNLMQRQTFAFPQPADSISAVAAKFALLAQFSPPRICFALVSAFIIITFELRRRISRMNSSELFC